MAGGMAGAGPHARGAAERGARSRRGSGGRFCSRGGGGAGPGPAQVRPGGERKEEKGERGSAPGGPGPLLFCLGRAGKDSPRPGGFLSFISF